MNPDRAEFLLRIPSELIPPQLQNHQGCATTYKKSRQLQIKIVLPRRGSIQKPVGCLNLPRQPSDGSDMEIWEEQGILEGNSVTE